MNGEWYMIRCDLCCREVPHHTVIYVDDLMVCLACQKNYRVYWCVTPGGESLPSMGRDSMMELEVE